MSFLAVHCVTLETTFLCTNIDFFPFKAMTQMHRARWAGEGRLRSAPQAMLGCHHYDVLELSSFANTIFFPFLFFFLQLQKASSLFPPSWRMMTKRWILLMNQFPMT